MTPTLHPFLVNGRFGDPALYVDFRFEKRAFLFDMGDLGALAPRQLLRIGDVFVSHAHVDHLIGFDHLLRTLLGREKRVNLYGPRGFIARIGHKLAGYSWNLAHRFATDLVFGVVEAAGGNAVKAATFRLQNRFRREACAPPSLDRNVLFRDAAVQVSFATLDHGLPCLGFAVEEVIHVNIWKARLRERGLAVGPWLRELKRAVREGLPDEAPIAVDYESADGARPRVLPLGVLKREVLRIVAGQKIAYVTDVAYTEANARAIAGLARGADLLFIEAVFAAEDHTLAAARSHLTTPQAGDIARRAEARRVEPFHFSPRYAEQEGRMLAEVQQAFLGRAPGG